MNQKPKYYVSEGFAYRLASRRFVGGMIVGAALMAFTPMFKAICKISKESYNKVADKYGYETVEDNSDE